MHCALDNVSRCWYFIFAVAGSMLASWFNWGTDPVLEEERFAAKNQYTSDSCLFMRFEWSNRTVNDRVLYRVSYPWYEHQRCSGQDENNVHPFICEYEGMFIL